MLIPAQNKKRIDDFITVVSGRYEDNPVGWEGVYERLYSMLDGDSKAYLESLWKPIVYKKALEAWDEFFLECTINPNKLPTGLNTQREYYERMQRQMMNANPLQNSYYTNPATWASTSAGGIYPVTTNTTTSPTLVDRILGRK